MRYESASVDFFVRNRARLCNLLGAKGIAILHSNDLMPRSADLHYPFKQNSDLYYLSGIDQEESALVIFPDATDVNEREILFVRETNKELAQWEGKKLSKEKATALSGIRRVEWMKNFDLIFSKLLSQADAIYLNSNEHQRAHNDVPSRDERFIAQCKKKFPLHDYRRLAPLMAELRLVKQLEEIKMIQRAIDITEAGLRRVLKCVKPGIGEWELEAEFAYSFLQQKSRGFSYPPIIATGANACILHYTENHNLCEDGDLLLMDIGAEYANWNADITRTIPISGRFTPRQRAVYESVLTVLKKCQEILRPGLEAGCYKKQALEFMQEELIALNLIDPSKAEKQNEQKPLVKKFFMHGVSHHLGLDVHDVHPADPSTPFEEGMVLTIEPGIYIREENLAVRLEDNILIGKNSNTNLSANIPIEPDEIEDIMRN